MQTRPESLKDQLDRIEEQINQGNPCHVALRRLVIDHYDSISGNKKHKKRVYELFSKSVAAMSAFIIAKDIELFKNLRIDELTEKIKFDMEELNPTNYKLTKWSTDLGHYVINDIMSFNPENKHNVSDAMISIEYWINVAYELLINPDIRDYSGSMAVLSGLDNQAVNVIISRLEEKNQINALSENSKNKLAELRKFLMENHSAELKKSQKESKDSLIPFKGIYQTQLTTRQEAVDLKKTREGTSESDEEKKEQVESILKPMRDAKERLARLNLSGRYQKTPVTEGIENEISKINEIHDENILYQKSNSFIPREIKDQNFKNKLKKDLEFSMKLCKRVGKKIEKKREEIKAGDTGARQTKTSPATQSKKARRQRAVTKPRSEQAIHARVAHPERKTDSSSEILTTSSGEDSVGVPNESASGDVISEGSQSVDLFMKAFNEARETEIAFRKNMRRLCKIANDCLEQFEGRKLQEKEKSLKENLERYIKAYETLSNYNIEKIKVIRTEDALAGWSEFFNDTEFWKPFQEVVNNYKDSLFIFVKLEKIRNDQVIRDLIIQPIQRMMKYKILFEAVSKGITKDTEQYRNKIQELIKRADDIIHKINQNASLGLEGLGALPSASRLSISEQIIKVNPSRTKKSKKQSKKLRIRPTEIIESTQPASSQLSPSGTPPSVEGGIKQAIKEIANQFSNACENYRQSSEVYGAALSGWKITDAGSKLITGITADRHFLNAIVDQYIRERDAYLKLQEALSALRRLGYVVKVNNAIDANAKARYEYDHQNNLIAADKEDLINKLNQVLRPIEDDAVIKEYDIAADNYVLCSLEYKRELQNMRNHTTLSKKEMEEVINAYINAKNELEAKGELIQERGLEARLQSRAAISARQTYQSDLNDPAFQGEAEEIRRKLANQLRGAEFEKPVKRKRAASIDTALNQSGSNSQSARARTATIGGVAEENWKQEFLNRYQEVCDESVRSARDFSPLMSDRVNYSEDAVEAVEVLDSIISKVEAFISARNNYLKFRSAAEKALLGFDKNQISKIHANAQRTYSTLSRYLKDFKNPNLDLDARSILVKLPEYRQLLSAYNLAIGDFNSEFKLFQDLISNLPDKSESSIKTIIESFVRTRDEFLKHRQLVTRPDYPVDSDEARLAEENLKFLEQLSFDRKSAEDLIAELSTHALKVGYDNACRAYNVARNKYLEFEKTAPTLREETKDEISIVSRYISARDHFLRIKGKVNFEDIDYPEVNEAEENFKSDLEQGILLLNEEQLQKRADHYPVQKSNQTKRREYKYNLVVNDLLESGSLSGHDAEDLKGYLFEAPSGDRQPVRTASADIFRGYNLGGYSSLGVKDAEIKSIENVLCGSDTGYIDLYGNKIDRADYLTSKISGLLGVDHQTALNIINAHSQKPAHVIFDCLLNSFDCPDGVQLMMYPGSRSINTFFENDEVYFETEFPEPAIRFIGDSKYISDTGLIGQFGKCRSLHRLTLNDSGKPGYELIEVQADDQWVIDAVKGKKFKSSEIVQNIAPENTGLIEELQQREKTQLTSSPSTRTPAPSESDAGRPPAGPGAELPQAPPVPKYDENNLRYYGDMAKVYDTKEEAKAKLKNNFKSNPFSGLKSGANMTGPFINKARVVYQDIRDPKTNHQIRAATIQTTDMKAKTHRSDFYFDDVSKFKDVPRSSSVISSLFGGTSIPGEPVMEWAAAQVQNFLDTQPQFEEGKSETMNIIAGNLPKVCIEALVLYCKAKGIEHHTDTRVKVSDRQVNMLMKKWDKWSRQHCPVISEIDINKKATVESPKPGPSGSKSG